MNPRIAVFPVAGLGTRFLPMTRAVPKELLPVVDRPVIHYALDEARNSGVSRFILITGRGKTVIEDHFDSNQVLEQELERRNHGELLAALRDMPSPGQISYVRQGAPRGLGHAVHCARYAVGDEPFVVMLPDDFIYSSPSALARLMDARGKVKEGCLIGVQEVARSEVSRYGIIDAEPAGDGILRVKAMVEKPAPDAAPSRLAAVGRYILTPEIFPHLEAVASGPNGEVELTDALAAVAAEGRLHAVKLPGVRFDCGSKIGLLQANLQIALEREDLAPRLRKFLRQLEL